MAHCSDNNDSSTGRSGKRKKTNYHHCTLSPSTLVSLCVYISIFILNSTKGVVESRYIDSCSLRPTVVRFQFDVREQKFQETTSVNGATGGRRSVEVAEGVNYHLRLRRKKSSSDNRHKIRTASTVSPASIVSPVSPASSYNKNKKGINTQKQNNTNTNTILARECACGSSHRGSTTYCSIQNGENYCRVPNSTNEEVQCYKTSIYQDFISSSWPLALLWLLALLIYLVVTEGGRSTMKYMLSSFFGSRCCCNCGCDVLSNNRTIDDIIAHEAVMRELIQMAQITHGGQTRMRNLQQQQRQELEQGSQPVTYILKTTAYDDGSSMEKKVAAQGHLSSSPLSSPSNDTMSTTPDSNPSCSFSFSFEDSPRIDQNFRNEGASNNNNSMLSSSSSSFSNGSYVLQRQSPCCSSSIGESSNNSNNSNNSINSNNSNNSSSNINSDSDNKNNENSIHSSTLQHQMDHESNNNTNSSNGYGGKEEEEEGKENVICTICMLDITNGDRVGVLPCKHLFHSDCLKEWIKRRNVCPLCQAPDIAEERPPPHRPTMTNSDGDASPRIIHPAAFIVRTTGSPIAHHSRRRTRQRYNNNNNNNQTSVSLNGSDGRGQSRVSRQLFQVNGAYGRSLSSPTSSRRVSRRTTRVVGIGRRNGVDNGRVHGSGGSITVVTNRTTRASRDRQQRQILVGDAALARPSSNIHRTMNSLSLTIEQQP